jgi:hypothetical protein
MVSAFDFYACAFLCQRISIGDICVLLLVGSGGPKSKLDLREIRWGGMDWIDLAQDRDKWRALVNTVMKLRVP